MSSGDEEVVDHPKHYNVHPSGVECITITEHFTFNIGNAVKYLWRAGNKGSQLEDLKKARWYVDREIARLTFEELKKEGAERAAKIVSSMGTVRPPDMKDKALSPRKLSPRKASQMFKEAAERAAKIESLMNSVRPPDMKDKAFEEMKAIDRVERMDRLLENARERRKPSSRQAKPKKLRAT